jgi:YCII-related domain
MAKYVLAYSGGSMPETEEAGAAVMAAWGAWLGGLGDAIVDGGTPFGASASITSDGGVSDAAASQLTGYSIVTADSLSAATTLVKDCPALSSGGTVDVYETIDM